MKRIDGLDRAVDLFGPGKDGFKAQVPGVSLATQLVPKWFNATQESIVRTIEAAGIGLSEADMDQFVTALGVLDGRARDAAILAAAIDATNKAAGARAAAIDAAAQDATNKANSARVAAIAAAALDATAKANAVIPAGTRMLFQQSAAPLGWTKITTHDNKALRVVAGNASFGGSMGFNIAFAARNVGETALTIDQMPAHGGHIGVSSPSGTVEDGQSAPNYTTTSLGGGAPHGHPINFDVQYVDVIIASKN